MSNTFVPALTNDETLFVRSLYNTMIGSSGPNKYVPRLARLKRAITVFHGLTLAPLEGPCRAKPYVLARIDYSHLAMKHCSGQVTLTQIGKSINRDHTTVMNHLKHEPGDLRSIEKILDVQ